MENTVLSTAPGKVIEYLGEPCMVLEHRADGTLLLVLEPIRYSFGSSNNFATSKLRDHLNGPYLDTLTRGKLEVVITRTVDLTDINGNKKYDICECKVAPLTLDEIRKFHNILPMADDFEWSATPWGTSWVTGRTPDGDISGAKCEDTYDVRPAFLIPSNTVAGDVIDPLAQYSTNELIAEVNRRMNG